MAKPAVLFYAVSLTIFNEYYMEFFETLNRIINRREKANLTQ